MVSLLVIYFKSKGSAYYLLAFGVMFFVLNMIVPLIVNVWGYAYTIRWGQDHKIDDNYVYLIYSLYLLGVSLSYFVISFLIQKRNKFSPGRSVSIRDLRFLHFLVGMAVCFGFFLYVVGTGMSLLQLLNSSRFAWFAEGSVQGVTLNAGLYFISLISIYAFLDVKLKFPNKALSVFVYSSIILMIAISGGRKWVIFLASGFLAGFFDRKGGVSFNYKYILSVAVAVIFMYAWQYGRNMVVEDGVAFSTQLYERSTDGGELFLRGDASYFYRASLEAIDINYNQQVSYPGALALRLMLLPFPESWTFGLKPKGVPELFANDIGAYNGARSGNMPPGLIGLFVLSFGALFGVLVFSLSIPLALLSIEIKEKETLGLFEVALAAHFLALCALFLRGSTGGVYYMVFGFVFISVAFFSIKVLRRLYEKA